MFLIVCLLGLLFWQHSFLLQLNSKSYTCISKFSTSTFCIWPRVISSYITHRSTTLVLQHTSCLLLLKHVISKSCTKYFHFQRHNYFNFSGTRADFAPLLSKVIATSAAKPPRILYIVCFC